MLTQATTTITIPTRGPGFTDLTDNVSGWLSRIGAREGLLTAFAYKNSGLDTIYLFSDGLPNIGEGLTLTESVTLAEPQKAAPLERPAMETAPNVSGSWFQASPRSNSRQSSATLV